MLKNHSRDAWLNVRIIMEKYIFSMMEMGIFSANYFVLHVRIIRNIVWNNSYYDMVFLVKYRALLR